MDGAGWMEQDGAAPARAQPVSGQPCVRARKVFIFLAAWQGMGAMTAIGSSGDALCPGVDGSLTWAPGGGSRVGCSGCGVLAGAWCELQSEGCSEADALRKGRPQAGIVPCPTDWCSLVPRGFLHWWCS